MAWARLLTVALVVFSGCRSRATSTDAPVAPPSAGTGTGACDAFGEVRALGVVGAAQLVEISGLAASRAHPGRLYAHNDSGDEARFFALSEAGQPLGELRLTGVKAIDWEDMAVGPCPSRSCVYLGDIGDNRRVRERYVVHRVPEPERAESQAVPFESLAFVYPHQERHNAEALLVHPTTGDIYVVTKSRVGLPSAVYRFPSPVEPARTHTLVHVADLPIPTGRDAPLSAGDIHPSGRSVLFRTYDKVFLLTAPDGQPFEAAFQATPVPLPAAAEPQGEAIAFRHDGRGYFTVSEGKLAPLHFVGCR